MLPKLLAAFALVILVLFTPSTVLAQNTSTGRGASTLLPNVSENPWAKDCLEKGDCHLSQIPAFILYISNYLVGLAGTVTLVMVMYGGYLYILGGINDSNKGKGMKAITNALMGFAVTLLAYVIVKALEGLLL